MLFRSGTISVNNSGLSPTQTSAYDVSLEYYFAKTGVFSVGAFRKDIRSYIYTDSSQIIGNGQDNGFDGLYAGYTLTTQRNGGSARIDGLEFSYQQQLSFLPSWSKGFGLSANYTTLRTEGNYGGTTVLTNNSLPGFVNKSGNLGLSYRGRGLDLRLQAIYRGNYLVANSTTPALVQYQKEKITWVWKSRYAVTRNASLFLDLDKIGRAHV